MHHAIELGEAVFNVGLSRSATAYRLHRGGQVLDIDLRTDAGGRSWLRLGERQVEVVIATRGDEVFVQLEGAAYRLRYRHPLDRLAALHQGAADDGIRAPMPGSLVSVEVAAGAAVVQNQTLLVMESMKMETRIAAPRDGVVREVHYAPGQSFERDALLLSLEPAAPAAAGPAPARS